VAIEKLWASVPPVAITANGTSDGHISVPDSRQYHVKQIVQLFSNVTPVNQYQIKRINSMTDMELGPVSQGIKDRSNLTMYLVSDVAKLSVNEEQSRPKINIDDTMRAVYQEEPAVALRTMMVDPLGDFYDDTNPLPIAFDGTVQVGDVSIVEGGNTMDVNSDGSINVNVVNSSPTSTPGLNITYNEVSAVASGATTSIINFLASGSGFRVFKIDVSGDNFATYTVLLNGTPIYTKRTWFSNFNTGFVFDDFTNGLKLIAGDRLIVNVLHNRPYPGTFEATLTGLNL
jgi:hypothetical protein